jgi:hypothetical protein
MNVEHTPGLPDVRQFHGSWQIATDVAGADLKLGNYAVLSAQLKILF